MLSLLVKPMLCLPSQVLVRKGETGHKMFFIQKGLIEVCAHVQYVNVCPHCVVDDSAIFTRYFHSLQILDGTTRVGTLKGGDVFGEVNLVYSEMHSATVCAVTHCDVLTLSRADLTRVSNAYPAGELLLSLSVFMSAIQR